MSDTPEKTYLLPPGIQAKTIYVSMPCEAVAAAPAKGAEPPTRLEPPCGHYAIAGTVLLTPDGANMVSVGGRWCQRRGEHSVHGDHQDTTWTGEVAICVCCEARAHHVASVLWRLDCPTLSALARGSNKAIYLCDDHYRMDFATMDKIARDRVFAKQSAAHGAGCPDHSHELFPNHHVFTECWPVVEGGVYTVDDGIIAGAVFYHWIQSAVKLAKRRGGDWKFRVVVNDNIPEDVMQAAQSFWRDQTGINATLSTDFRRITLYDLRRSYTLSYSAPKTPIRREPERSELESWTAQVADTVKALAKAAPAATLYVGSQKVVAKNFQFSAAAPSPAIPPVAARCSPMTHAALPQGCERKRWDAVVVAVNADVREPPRGPRNKNAAEHIHRDLLCVAAVLPAYVKLRREGYGKEAAGRLAIADSPFRDDPDPITRYLRVYEAAR